VFFIILCMRQFHGGEFSVCSMSVQKVLGLELDAVGSCLATQEAEVRRIVVQSQPGQIVCETLS
jgi:hypothetical protein